MDRRGLDIKNLFEPPPPTELTQAPICAENDAMDLRAGSSAKIDQLMHLLRLTPENEKSLVFSQFTTFLDKVSSLVCLFLITRLNACSKKIEEVLDKEGSAAYPLCLLFCAHL